MVGSFARRAVVGWILGAALAAAQDTTLCIRENAPCGSADFPDCAERCPNGICVAHQPNQYPYVAGCDASDPATCVHICYCECEDDSAVAQEETADRVVVFVVLLLGVPVAMLLLGYALQGAGGLCRVVVAPGD